MSNRNEQTFRILVLNPGSTSTKISVFENEEERFTEVLRHPESDLKDLTSLEDQLVYRRKVIEESLKDWPLNSFTAIVGRGGLVKPLASGTYSINETMLNDLKLPQAARHPSSLGAILAHELAAKAGNIPNFIVDPVVVDEMEPIAKISGWPEFQRISIFHALNQKAVARQCAHELGMKYEDARLVVAHLGGGISVGAHRYGQVVDVNNALDGGGPFSPERAGTLPTSQLVKLCFSKKMTEDEVMRMLQKKGGLSAHLGSSDLRECEKSALSGDGTSYLVIAAMAYQIAKEIGSMVAALEGRVDAIALTGGLVYSVRFAADIKNQVEALAPVYLYPGEKEMDALALGALRVLRGEEKAKTYG